MCVPLMWVHGTDTNFIVIFESDLGKELLDFFWTSMRYQSKKSFYTNRFYRDCGRVKSVKVM